MNDFNSIWQKSTTLFFTLLISTLSYSQDKTYTPYIPFEKNLDQEWIKSLYEKGVQKIYKGDELKWISMPCGGIGAGQLEITGTGELGSWYIFNESPATNRGRGFANGAGYIDPLPIEQNVESGFAIKIQEDNEKTKVLKLDGTSFNNIEFVGEYPIASFKFKSTEENLSVTISSKVFSPFVPLDLRSSANPVTTVSFTVTNTSTKRVKVDLAGFLENVCETHSEGQRINESFRSKNLTGVQLGVKFNQEYPAQNMEEVELFDDFENDTFNNKWSVEGNAFGHAPLLIYNAQFPTPVNNYGGIAFACSRLYKWDSQKSSGKLISKEFSIKKRVVRFKIAGGNFENETCMNLVVDGKTVLSATGKNANDFEEVSWDVQKFIGKNAHFVIVDTKTDGGAYDHIMIDDIEFVNPGIRTPAKPRGNGEKGFGNMAISVMDSKATTSTNLKNGAEFLKNFEGKKIKQDSSRVFDFNEKGVGTVSSAFGLEPNERKTVTFLISWYFPNLYNYHAGGLVGHIYNNWYNSSTEVAQWIANNFIKLEAKTELFRSTYHNTTLPYWLINRISMPLSTMACENIMIHESGRLYAYEGVNFCYGTCGHVYNFVTAIANLFPELERSVRILQDFDERYGFDPLTGRINFRGEHGSNPKAYCNYASDAQSGYVLKTYREHLHTTNNQFLETVWPKVKMAMNYQVFRDGAERSLEPNGVLEDKQTFWDPMYWGPNPYNNTLYLAALRAAEKMARIMGEDKLADRYKSIYESGSKWMEKKMWNGAYYVSLYPEGKWSTSWNGVVQLYEEQNNAANYVRTFGERDKHYYKSTECDAQQLFGQNWAHQLNLGYILPKEHCKEASKSIFKYNWTPDISMVYDLYPPHNRTLAAKGEAAMVNGAWPQVKRQPFENTHDKDDVWTGLEYESACDMINEGNLDEAFVIIRSIDERYDGVKRNPWNEIEGANHYSRAMQSWNVLLSISGFTFDGPAGKIGFAPKITPNNFKSFFSAAKGWGTFEQKQTKNKQECIIMLKYGTLSLTQISVDIPAGETIESVKINQNGETLKTDYEQKENRVKIKFDSPLSVKDLTFELKY